MADLDYGGTFVQSRSEDAPGGFDGRAGRLVNLVGGVVSIALLAGLAVWGYRLLVRDVAGVPVIQAMEGPMRVQPDDPGGNRAAHQGLAVNRIAAVGEAAPPPEEIVLAPRSVDLAEEDVAQGYLRTAPALVPAVEERPAAARAEPVDPIEAAILAATTQVLTAEAELSGEGLIEIVPASLPGPSRSLRPRLRPANFESRSAAAAADPGAASPVAAEGVMEVDAATLDAGTRLVQFGAFDTAEEARDAWAELAGRFGTLMAEKGRVVEEASTGGRTFYRLRAAGFEDLADARRFCAAFVAEGTDCIPVLTR